jgi:hypothetical protein
MDVTHASATISLRGTHRNPPAIQGDPPPDEPCSTTPEPAFNPEPSLILKSPPPLHPLWLAHEATLNLKSQLPITDPTAKPVKIAMPVSYLVETHTLTMGSRSTIHTLMPFLHQRRLIASPFAATTHLHLPKDLHPVLTSQAHPSAQSGIL